MTGREVREIANQKEVQDFEKIVFDKIIGMTDAEAKNYCGLRDYSYRSHPQGKGPAGQGADINFTRINAVTREGRVIKYQIG